MPARIFQAEVFLIWLALVLMGLLLRPLTPVDETRAVSVAWEMWQRGDFWVPYLNGQPYNHKPPLLQWCIHLGWWVFGVNEWSARLVGPLFALGNLVLTAKLARRLWPDDDTSHRLAPLMLLAMPVWALWTSLTLYDMPVTFFTLLGLLGILRAAHGEGRAGWALLSLGIAGGVLSKGPVILIFILPPALSAPGWFESKPAKGWRGWYGPLFVSVLAGALLALAWVIPAGLAGGEEYRRAIFWSQSAGRINNAFAHKQPFWWYLALLPALWLPWTAWPPLWRSARKSRLDHGLRFLSWQLLPVLVALSLISGKRIHYLLPVFPAAALFAARLISLARPQLTRIDALPAVLLLALPASALLLLPWLGLSKAKPDLAQLATQNPWVVLLPLLGLALGLWYRRPAHVLAGVRAIALGMAGLMLCAHWVYRPLGLRHSDMQAFAERLAVAEREGTGIAHWREYHGDFHFLGRLQKPLTVLDSRQTLLAWMDTHRQGYVVLVRQPDPSLSEEGAEFAQSYRGRRRILLWKSAVLLERSAVLDRMLGGQEQSAGNLLPESLPNQIQ